MEMLNTYSHGETLPSSRLKMLLLDFDGVILESANLKTDAFRDLFSYRPEAVDRIVALHESMAGVSRYEKFRLIYSDILREPLSAEQSAQLGRRFSELALEKILACPFVPGAEPFIRSHADKLPLLIITGTPDEEIVDILHRRSLDELFGEVHGGSRSKTAIVRDILDRYSLAATEVLFVGDSMTDYDAAQANGVHFVGRVPIGMISAFPESTRLIEDLTGLDAAISAVFSR